MNTIWQESAAQRDQTQAATHISHQGKLIGYSELVVPENDRERFMTFMLVHGRRTRVDTADLTPLFTITPGGTIRGEIEYWNRMELESEKHTPAAPAKPPFGFGRPN
ncbi:MAG: hypothetical protein NT069_26225 [Planctomycetota bacterium]|nr:hypothetical protein [Planctomycetota bacterium]